MSGLEFLRLVKESEQGCKKDIVPANIEEAMIAVNDYISIQLPLTFDMDFVPVCFDMTQDEKKIFIGGRYGNIAVFSVELKKITKDIELSSIPVISVCLAVQDSIAIVVTESGTIYILEFPSFYLRRTLVFAGCALSYRLNFLKDAMYLVNNSKFIHLIDFEKFDERLIEVSDNVNCIDLSDDNSLIALGLDTGSLLLLHGESEISLQSTEPYEFGIDIVSFSEFRKWVAVGYRNFLVKVYNIDAELSLKTELPLHVGMIRGLEFVRKSRYLVTGGADNKIIVLDMKVEGEPFFLEMFDEPVLHFKTSPDKTKLYFSQDINKMMIWSIPTLSKNSRLKKHTEKINKVLFVPGGYELLTIGDDGLVILWDYRNSTEQEVIEIDGKALSGIVSSTAKFAFFSSDKPSLIRLSLNTYKFYAFSVANTIVSMNLNPEEDLLALGDSINRILIFDAITMERKYVMKGHLGLVTGLFFIYSNETLLTSSQDSTLVKWDVKNSIKQSTLSGHQASVNALLVIPGEKFAISGSSDNTIIIWSLEFDVVLNTITMQTSISGVISLYLSNDQSYLLSLQEDRITFLQMSNLCVMFEKDSADAAAFAVDADEKYIGIAEKNSLFIEENPLTSETIKVVGKKYGSNHKFMNFVREIQGSSSRVVHSDAYNHWMFTPYRLGIAHILSFINKNILLTAVLLDTDNKASFCSTIQDENPLSISVNMDHVSCVEICLKYIKSEYANNNLRAFMPLANCLSTLTTLDILGIPRLYDIIFTQSSSLHLPSFCVEGISTLPSLCKSEDIMINVDELLPVELRASHGESIAFFGTLCPLYLELGSEESVKFLESLMDCQYDTIFRSRLLQVLLRSKFEQVKNAINIQGGLYILYLVQLAFYTIFFKESNLFLVSIFLVHGLLFFYEVLQIATDFWGYWPDAWNLLDQLRGFSFTIYFFLQIQGTYNASVLLTVTIFSWTRGISYFRMFEGTRYMVRLLSEVIKDMQVFFIILFYSTLAFTFIFYINEGTLAFGEYLTVSYRLDLADFVLDGYGPFDWVIFFFASVINPLVMMNLLISIMGTTYERVKEGNDIANYVELTSMIVEIEKLMFWKKNKNVRTFFQQCIPLLELEEGDVDKVNLKMKNLKKMVIGIEASITEICDGIKPEQIEEINGELERVRSTGIQCNEVLARNEEVLKQCQEVISRITGCVVESAEVQEPNVEGVGEVVDEVQ